MLISETKSHHNLFTFTFVLITRAIARTEQQNQSNHSYQFKHINMSSNDQRSDEENRGVHTSSPKLKDPPSSTVQLQHHHKTQPSSTSFSISTNHENTSSIHKMNTSIGVSTLHQSGVNFSSNIGDNSMLAHGVNTISNFGVNTNSTFGVNTRQRQGYKAHKARRTYAKRQGRIGVHTSSRLDNRYSKVGPCDVKSQIRLVLIRHPQVKRKFSAIIKNWIYAQRDLNLLHKFVGF